MHRIWLVLGGLSLFLAGMLCAWVAAHSWTTAQANRGLAGGAPLATRGGLGPEMGPRTAEARPALERARDLAADPAVAPLPLRPGQPRKMTMTFRESPVHHFVIDVPEDAVMLRVNVTGAPCIFDIYGRTLLPIEDPTTDAEHYNDAAENRLLVSRYMDYPLETGPYYLTMEYASLYPPVLGNRTLSQASYEISVSFVSTRIDGVLQPDRPTVGRLDPESGSFRTYVIDVPARAPALRLDLDNTHSDLDLLLRREEQILFPEDADHMAAGAVGREIVVIDGRSAPTTAPGRWYVNVVDSSVVDEAEFTLYASLDPEPPEALLGIPAPPPTPDGLARALYAAVDLTTGPGFGSGVVVSPQGLILTNHHVVAEAIVAAQSRQQHARRGEQNGPAREPARDDVIVAVTLDPRHPPVEMFRGEVVEYDEKADLALVQVTRGYYGQPIPPGYEFPYVELGRPKTLEIGDPLFVVGFPWVGDLRNRPAVTLTRGVVSGFSSAKSIKTDAHISAGSSGGGAFDQNWRLMGCPTYVMYGYDGDYGQLGYVVSLDALPASWRRRLP